MINITEQSLLIHDTAPDQALEPKGILSYRKMLDMIIIDKMHWPKLPCREIIISLGILDLNTDYILKDHPRMNLNVVTYEPLNTVKLRRNCRDLFFHSLKHDLLD